MTKLTFFPASPAQFRYLSGLNEQVNVPDMLGDFKGTAEEKTMHLSLKKQMMKGKVDAMNAEFPNKYISRVIGAIVQGKGKERALTALAKEYERETPLKNKRENKGNNNAFTV